MSYLILYKNNLEIQLLKQTVIPNRLGKMRKYAYVSGASTGIGYALCEEFSKRGVKVYGGCPENELVLMEPLEALGVTPVACDVTNTEQIRKARDFVLGETDNRLDFLYNNAGIASAGPATEASDEEILRIFKVNVFGHIAVTREFIEGIKKSKGTIVFTASVAGKVAFPIYSLYCSTKAAIDHYANVLKMEMAPFDVKVVSVITGGVNTKICDSLAQTFPLGYELDFNVDGIQECAIAMANMSRKSPYNTSPKQYAEAVVSYISRRSPGFNYFKGSFATILTWLGKFTPLWFQHFVLARHYKFDRVAKNIRQNIQLREQKKTV